MASTGIIGGWRERPDVTMAGLGLISGALSARYGLEFKLEILQPLASVFFLESGALLIGVLFGAVIAFSIGSATRNLWAIPVLLVTTMYAWSAAIQVAIRLQRNAGEDPHLITASLAAGAIGAGLTHLGCALFSSGLRRPLRIVVTCMVGALAGMLFYLGERKFIDERLLYVVWQPAVAFCIGMGLTGRSQEA